MNRLVDQILKFGVVGIIATGIDYILLIFLKEICDIDYLLASGISYSVSTVVNYILTMRYVFEGKDNVSKIKEFLLFFVMSVVGLGVNQVVMWISTDILKIYYILSKILSTAIVMIYNFISRKVVLEKKE